MAAAQEQKMKKGILTEANYSLNGNDAIVRYFCANSDHMKPLYIR